MSTRTLEFRPLTHADAEFAAEMQTRDQPRRPADPDRVLRLWKSTEGVHEVRRFAVVAEGARVGWMSVIRLGGEVQHQAMVVPIVPGAHVDDCERVLGFGQRQAVEMGATAILCEPWESNAALVEALRRGEWEQKRRQRFWRLELAPAAESLRTQVSDASRRLRSELVQIATAAELGGEGVYPKLYEVNKAAHWDIPTTVPFEPDPYEVWLGYMAAPAVVPERVWVATVDGAPVGLSFLTYRPGMVDTGFTGVLREHRNKGIARALKLETLVQALDLGVEAVETDNDSENAPILHLNAQIGYREVTGQLQFHKQLD